jgi:L-amino acid N-acyltransferase YncA
MSRRSIHTVRVAQPHDAGGIAEIYAPIVRDTSISFELVPPGADEMRRRLQETLRSYPWLVSINEAGEVSGYAYASQHRARAAYQWSVDTTAYVRADAQRQGLGKALYAALFSELLRLGYCQAFAGIALPNPASIALHESVGFEPIGIYRRVGFKLGRWQDVGWWQKSLQTPPIPRDLI